MDNTARIVYGTALTDSSGGVVTVRIGDEITYDAAWGYDAPEWVEVDPAGTLGVDDIETDSADADPAAAVIAETADDTGNESDETPPDDATEHTDGTAPITGEGFAETDTERPVWDDELLDVAKAYAETMPDETAPAPSDDPYDDHSEV